MASVAFDAKTGKARVFFRHGGRQYNRTVRAKSERAAMAICETIDETISDLERGRISLPSGADLATFLISGGTVDTSRQVEGAAKAKPLALSDLFARYRADPPHHLEASTRKLQEIHFRRLRRFSRTKPCRRS